MLTVAEVAGMWRVSKMTVLRMVHSEQLDALRVGHRFRIPPGRSRSLHPLRG
ncbi:MAG TPA: helix-turn-helix domain-containing protein [Pseudonocardia sp.]|uniref:helix-turn-helix domain-containing protein n=1 Tax=Pseudonocardia sp. TaxID=60912 RepID=UPI002F41A089